LNLNSNWVAGFFGGDGCFSIKIYKFNTYKSSYGIILKIKFGQYYRDKLLLIKLMNILRLGNIYKCKNNNTMVLTISKF